MSTNNFSWDNILVVVDTDDWDENGMDCEMLEDDIQYMLLPIKEGYKVDKWEEGRRGGRKIWAVDIARYYKEQGTLIYKTIYIVLRSGYYSGMNIDYIIEDGEDIDTFKSVRGLEKEVEKMSRKIAKILRRCGTELVQLGSFSNGEAVYQVKK